MLILAIDTSTSAITVALHDDTRVLAAASHLDALRAIAGGRGAGRPDPDGVVGREPAG